MKGPTRIDPSREPEADRQISALLYPERDYWRPRTRGDCADVPRPCPFVTCRYNLYLEARPSGSILFNFPGLDVWDLPHTNCALDVAEEGGVELQDVGAVVGVTKQRIHQIQNKALLKLEYELPHLLGPDMARGVSLADQLQLSSVREV